MPEHLFQLQSENVDQVLVIAVSGRIDGVNAEVFHEHVGQEAWNSGDFRAIILDLEKLEYISSAGLRSILRIAKTFEAHSQKFALCSLSDLIKEIVEVTGFDKIIAIYDSQSVATKKI